MLLFVAAAALALFFAPTRGTQPVSVAHAPTAATGPATGEVTDPWKPRETRNDGPTVLSREAAELAAGDVVDPWAGRPQPPPGPVTVLDVPVDPWAGPKADPATAPVAARDSRRDEADGVRDPWHREVDAYTQRPRVRAGTVPLPATRSASRAELRDPWAKGNEARVARAKTVRTPRPKLERPRSPAAANTDGVADPWK